MQNMTFYSCSNPILVFSSMQALRKMQTSTVKLYTDPVIETKPVSE